jgi:ribokinase
LATSHLIKNGHNNIGLLLCNSLNSDKISEGYIRALYDSDILFDSNKVFRGQDILEAGKIGSHQLINMNVTAIVCENEKIACSLYQICSTYGVLIPKDISVICINTSGLSEMLSPRLDTVDLEIENIGKQAVRAMLSIVESKEAPNNIIREIDIRLKVGESVTSPFRKYNNNNKKIVVIGSMNMDININVDKMPTDGETLITNSIALLPGGKGANQAVGAGKLGGLVYAIGCIGNDNDGKTIYNSLVSNSVKADGVKFDSSLPTGKAYINIAKNGESAIVVYPGANDNLNIHQISKHKDLIIDAEFCLMSLEVSIKTIEFALNLCKKNKVKVMVKPSTMEKINDNFIKDIDYFIPNEKEINRLVEGDLSVIQKANLLFEKGVKNVIVTLGSKGCYLKNKDYSLLFEAAPFEANDTTGAADAFISALAVFMCEGNDLITSIKFALYAAGISITRQGVQTSMPDRMTLEMYRSDILNTLKVTKV